MSERRGPFWPCEQSLFVQLQGHGKSMRLPRLCEDGAADVLHGKGHLAAAVQGNFFKGEVGVLHGCRLEGFRLPLLSKIPKRLPSPPKWDHCVRPTG